MLSAPLSEVVDGREPNRKSKHLQRSNVRKRRCVCCLFVVNMRRDVSSDNSDNQAERRAQEEVEPGEGKEHD